MKNDEMLDLCKEVVVNYFNESDEIKNSREKSLTITKLEEAIFWLTYGIDIQKGDE